MRTEAEIKAAAKALSMTYECHQTFAETLAVWLAVAGMLQALVIVALLGSVMRRDRLSQLRAEIAMFGDGALVPWRKK